MSLANKLKSRKRETVNVEVDSPEGKIIIEIRKELTPSELKTHSKFMDRVSDVLSDRNLRAFEDDLEADSETCKFLEVITTNPDLDFDFWMTGAFNSDISEELFRVFFVQMLDEDPEKIKKLVWRN